MSFHFVKPDVNINFIGRRKIGYTVFAVLIVLSLASCILGNGISLGIDFAGGVNAQVRFEKFVDDETLKKGLDLPELPGLSVQRYGEVGRDYLLRFNSDNSPIELRTRIEESLVKAFPDNPASMERLEVVGPKVGKDLTEKGLSAIFYAILTIAVYISGRFEQRWMAAAAMAACLWGATYLVGLTGVSTGILVCVAMAVTLGVCFFLRLNFALAATASLLVTVAVAMGVLSVMQIDLDLNVLAAVLTIIGYALNDTIITFDRLRENLRLHTDKPMAELINRSINQTLARTVLTCGTTLLASVALLVLGGGVIYSFALTMTVGVVVGTFATMFISCPLLLALGDTAFYVKASQKEEYEKPGEHGMV
ncbi:MAG: protein translocase subunit SecF [Desulfovibrionaceae bacterium]|nr:protein translocase subunit SecF [Desulfovibrionaceae bacterium]